MHIECKKMMFILLIGSLLSCSSSSGENKFINNYKIKKYENKVTYDEIVNFLNDKEIFYNNYFENNYESFSYNFKKIDNLSQNNIYHIKSSSNTQLLFDCKNEIVNFKMSSKNEANSNVEINNTFTQYYQEGDILYTINVDNKRYKENSEYSLNELINNDFSRYYETFTLDNANYFKIYENVNYFTYYLDTNVVTIVNTHQSILNNNENIKSTIDEVYQFYFEDKHVFAIKEANYTYNYINTNRIEKIYSHHSIELIFEKQKLEKVDLDNYHLGNW